MTTRRIENPRYGMVVTDGTAGRTWMLVRRLEPLFHVSGDENRVWEALRLADRDDLPSSAPARDRIFLAPGEFAEVVGDELDPVQYLFVGGPADGKRIATGGRPEIMVPDIPPMPVFAYSDEPEDPATISITHYELRRDGRYHVMGGK